MSETPKVDDLDVFFPPSVKISIYDKKEKVKKEFEISEFVVSTRTVFVKFIVSIFNDLYEKQNELKGLTEASVFMKIIEISEGRLANIYAVVLGKPVEWVNDNVTLQNEMAILKAIFEVNDIPLLMSQIDSLTKRAKAQKTQV